MAKPKGLPKSGGRQKGTPNKRTIGFLEVLEGKGINLLETIIDEAMGLSGRDKINVLVDLLPYVYPKRKPTEQEPFSITASLDGMGPKELNQLQGELSRRRGTDRPLSQWDPAGLHKLKEDVEHALLIQKHIKDLEDDPWSQ